MVIVRSRTKNIHLRSATLMSRDRLLGAQARATRSAAVDVLAPLKVKAIADAEIKTDKIDVKSQVHLRSRGNLDTAPHSAPQEHAAKPSR